MTSKTYEATIVLEGSTCFIPVTFDPKVVFGKVRAPVLVTLNGCTYRSTIASMGGQVCIPLRKSNREAAGLKGGETLQVTLELDAEQRTVDVPPDLDKALPPAARARWDRLSYTQQRECVEAINAARKPDTRARRIAQTVVRLDRPS
ncbi:YdeI/OmpD-associated family protein [Bradyrhizobium sp. C9]|uniref:YdeI/OmpD-associated family protein n=1 Tax=Bradyrhizobium sp. C9 TaxID=142585 RepID=UPI0013047788|nr:YdeI/OmpD-associated family protein [Bradyrhizobium sp. C9]